MKRSKGLLESEGYYSKTVTVGSNKNTKPRQLNPSNPNLAINNKCFIYINGRKIDSEKINFISLINKHLDKTASNQVSELLTKIPVEQKMEKPVVKNIIHEANKSVFGIKAGKTKKKEIICILKNVLKKDLNFEVTTNYFQVEELGITLNFSVDDDVVEEIVLSSPFNGETLFGLKIGNSIEKAVELYGEPRIRSLSTAFWNNFSVSIRNETITSIKIR